MQEIENVLRIFREAKEAIKNNDSYKMKQLSQQTIHSATIYQDPDNIIVAVLIYSLGKIIEREHYKKMNGWDSFYKNVTRELEKTISCLEKKDLEGFRLSVGKIRNFVNKIPGDLRGYIQDVFRKAGINKAFKIYEHGLSSEQTAKLLGISLWDLATYIGQSSISEAKVSESLPVKERIKYAEEIFK